MEELRAQQEGSMVPISGDNTKEKGRNPQQGQKDKECFEIPGLFVFLMVMMDAPSCHAVSCGKKFGWG